MPKKQMESDNSTFNKLISLVKGKKVFLATHWDADGVTSAAILYHLIKKHTSGIDTLSKGDIFLIEQKDIKGDPDIILCVDIQPGADLDPQKVIYVDHHPHQNAELYLYSVHDSGKQSTSLLIWEKIMPDTQDPYLIFLTLLGYFGDNGDREKIPEKLLEVAKEKIPDMMTKLKSYYSAGHYYKIESFVSALNTGKRMFWSGNIPLEMLKDIEHYKDFVSYTHPIAQELQNFKQQLRGHYSQGINIVDVGCVQYALINSDKNIQGVLCARHIKEKPLMVLNRLNGKIIGSLRSPEKMGFDSGEYLSKFNGKLESFQGGGHTEAGGFTLDGQDLEKFLSLLKTVK